MVFKIAVKGIIRRGDGKILIVKRSGQDSYLPGKWEMVGGGVEEKEKPQIALAREIMEETGLRVVIREPFNVFTFENEKNEFKIGITFICEYAEGEVSLSDEHSEYAWIDPKDIKSYDTALSLCNEITTYANKYSRSYGKFNVSQKAVIIRGNKCFIAEVYKRPGVWDLPGGRIDDREDSLEAFRRELVEETGVSDCEILSTFAGATSMTPAGATVFATASLVRTDQEIVLSQEHVRGKWIGENEVDDHEYIWPAMNRMIKQGFRFNKLLAKNND